MTYSTDTPIVGPPTGTLAEALSWLDIKAGPETEYATELWRLCELVGIDPAVLFAQAAHETGDFSSFYWKSRLNPAGIGITGDKAQNEASQTWANGKEAAQGHVIHMYSYADYSGTNIVGTTKNIVRPLYEQDVRMWAIYEAHLEGTVRTLGDLTGKWATDPRYGEKIAAKLNAIFPKGTQPGEPNNQQEVTPMSLAFTTTIPGLPGGPLVTDYEIHVRILRESMKNNRPGIKAKSPRRSVQHGNGNPNAFAKDDSLWLYNGASGGTISFHAGADEFGVWYNVPADEVTWQAADSGGPGNMNGFSCEMSEHAVYRQDMTRLRKNIYVNADFMGRVAARLNIAVPEQHWTFNYESADRHNCPNILRTMSIAGVPCWTIYTNQWNASKADELKRMTPSKYTTPEPPPWKRGEVGYTTLGSAKVIKITAELTAKRNTTPHIYASSSSPESGPQAKIGTKVVMIGVATVPGNKRPSRWYLDEKGNRWSHSAFEPSLPSA